MSLSRRGFLATAGGTLLTATSGGRLAAQQATNEKTPAGAVDGHPVARQIGLSVLADGGNAIDAVVAAALVAAVVAPYQCGIGGYGGHMAIATAGGKKVTSIDFNTEAPAAAASDLFAPLDDGSVKDKVNDIGWLASGVPGTLAGLQLALDRYGSRPLAELLQPAIRYSEEGFVVDKWFAAIIKRSAPQLSRDPASARLYLPDGEPLAEGARLKNPQTAEMLRTLAKRGSVDSFYRGDIAQQIADAFKLGEGLLKADDLASYRAREVEPITFNWRDHTVCTAPLTSGGSTMIESLSLLNALGQSVDLTTPRGIHCWIEALRVAWHDRLTLFGDPKLVDVPLERLFSTEYAASMAEKIEQAAAKKQRIAIDVQPREQDGTIHLSAADREGNLVALTLTHGSAFGAHVTVDGLGIMLGAGMSRFDPHPRHPNCPAPKKRPLHNMCPTVVLKDGQPILAVGGAGGRRIPNAVTSVLWHYVGQNVSIGKAVAGPRVHTEGGDEVWFDGPVVDTAEPYLKDIEYAIIRRKVALASAASFNPKDGKTESASG